jgi:DNA-directed RNA polymerase subunit RPC12/RpoP
VSEVFKVFCPTDKNLLLKSGDGRPLYQCSDCSGVLVTLPALDESTESETVKTASRLRCPIDHSPMYISETSGVVVYRCHKCACAWADGDAQEKLMSRLPSWFGKPTADTTAGTVAGAVVTEAILSILLG